MSKSGTSLKGNLRVAREKKGYSKRGLSVRAGLSTNTVQYIESGYRVDPATSHSVALAKALGTTVEKLWGR